MMRMGFVSMWLFAGLLVAGGEGGVTPIEAREPTSPNVVPHLGPESHVTDLRYDGNRMLAVDAPKGLHQLDPIGYEVADPPLPARIALTINRPGNADLVIWNWLTGEFLPLAPSPHNECHATWSPDGSWIAFETDRDGNYEVYLVRPDCVAPGSGCDPELRNLTRNPSFDLYPNWSPDDRVVHMSMRSGNPEIWLTPLDDGSPLNLTNHPGEDWHPNLSPLGGVLALMSYRGENPEIWRVDLSTGESTNLTASPGVDRYPIYAPDGRQIVFVSDRDGNEEIYVMGAEGASPVNLTRHPARDYSPSWSPDGRWVLFVSDRDGAGDLYIIPASGGDAELVLDAEDPIDYPFWAPVD